ncbi:hypothetical protein PLICRDRAFT_443514 [Plicaturopsis crispa FD-325 SS-3]|uniref:DUF6534 domain-containing protein n=1 Tax=Plicaturopsis crispa FD-325 SS-3 TaxID=944288 RepID=A0A0C9SQJ5_PLICR|nr:hypothetical protein PLICRDRAFT_443514 [Plicaturopsis crispa FD-325 SS-3]
MAACDTLDLEKALGATEIGILFSLCLFGVVSSQTYTYFRRFLDDERWMKALVGAIWICELVYSVCVSITLYTMTVKDFSRPSSLITPPLGTDICILVAGTISALTQAFFARRIRILSGRLPLAIMCWALCVARFAISFMATVESFGTTTWIVYIAGGRWTSVSLLGASVFTDLLIAGSLCYYLLRERSRAITPTVAILDKLLVWTIHNGLLTSVASLTMLITFLAAPGNFTWLGIFMFLPRLFSMSLLGSLNARTSLRRDLQVTIMSSVQHYPQLRVESADELRYRADGGAGKDVSAELCPPEGTVVTPRTVRILGHGTTGDTNN